MKRTGFKPKNASIAGMLRTAQLKKPSKPTLTAKPRIAKCAICQVAFRPRNAIRENWCSVECGAALGVRLLAIKKMKLEKTLAKTARVDVAKRRLAAKPRAKWLAEAQAAFNAFIRARDAAMPCISSGRPLLSQAAGGGFDAGHYRSIGSAPHLRFNEQNVHGQSKQDNRYLAGNAVDYRIGLIARVGLAEVEALEANNAFCTWSIDQLIAIKAAYKLKLKRLINGAR